MERTVLKVRNLKKYYREVKAVDGITFEVKEGEIFALLGPNGAGKTTTIKCILGFKKADNGEIGLNGKAAYLPEDKSLYKSYTVERLLKTTDELTSGFNLDAAKKFLEEVKVPLNEKIVNLSHGMKTLVYLSLIFAQDADLYVFDEPTWGLDPVMRELVLEKIVALSLEGSAVLYTSHILSEVEKTVYRVGIMVGGVLVEVDEIDGIKDKYVAVHVGKDESLDGFLYKETSDGKVYIVKKREGLEDYEPATFEMIFNSMVRSVRR